MLCAFENILMMTIGLLEFEYICNMDVCIHLMSKNCQPFSTRSSYHIIYTYIYTYTVGMFCNNYTIPCHIF